MSKKSEDTKSVINNSDLSDIPAKCIVSGQLSPFLLHRWLTGQSPFEQNLPKNRRMGGQEAHQIIDSQRRGARHGSAEIAMRLERAIGYRALRMQEILENNGR